MAKLIIQHGERVTEHVLGEAPVEIGRDPLCDLFFADKKLSRRHARIEQDGPAFKLVDLGSRNGSWINEERVGEVVLENGDAIRLGGLHISFEAERDIPEDLGDESTVYLTADKGPDDSSTVLLSAPVPETAEEERVSDGTVMLPKEPETEGGAADAEASSTVLLPAAERDEAIGGGEESEETLERPQTPPSPEDAGTVILTGHSEDRDPDTGTVLFRGQVDPEIAAATRLAPAASQEEGNDAARASSLVEEVLAVPPRAARSWSGLFVPLIVGVALLPVLVLAVPLALTLADGIRGVSQLRARALVDVLVAENEAALGEARRSDLSVARVEGAPGVRGAYILDTSGRVLAPSQSAGEPLAIEGLGMRFENVRRWTLAETESGERVAVQPLMFRGRRIGAAVVRYEVPAIAGGRVAMIAVLGAVLTLLGVAFAVLLARRATVTPIVELRKKVEATAADRETSISAGGTFSELEELAKSIDRLAFGVGDEPTQEGGSRPSDAPS